MSNCKHFPNADDHCLVCEETRPSDIVLPEGWTWDRVEAERSLHGIGDHMVPVVSASGIATAWITINAARIDQQDESDLHAVHVSQDKLSIDDDMGTENYIRTIRGQSLLGIRRAVRDLNPGRIPIDSPYDCTGLVCYQSCKFLKIYRCYAGYYVAVVELHVTRDV